eukprot:evm.model.scf_86.7 EVM.evm.TU.scf_86.7   scf_86:68944-69502(+)
MPKAIPDSAASGNAGDRVILHGGPPMGNLASSFSPYVAKTELFLRVAGIDYDADVNYKGPKGKVPHDGVPADDSLLRCWAPPRPLTASARASKCPQRGMPPHCPGNRV